MPSPERLEELRRRGDIHGLETTIVSEAGTFIVVFHWPIPERILPSIAEVRAHKVLELAERFTTMEAAAAAAARVMEIALHGLRDVGYAAEQESRLE